jgi:hypothetical protein
MQFKYTLYLFIFLGVLLTEIQTYQQQYNVKDSNKCLDQTLIRRPCHLFIFNYMVYKWK